MTEIKYRQIEGVPGQYFDCPNGVGMFSVQTCARLYGEAMSLHGLREGLRITCRSCPVGAVHSGREPSLTLVSRMLGSTSCSRCHSASRRMIRGSICVSCYNREREVLIGRNSKGGRPVYGRPIFPTIVAFVPVDGNRLVVRRMDRVSSSLEAVLTVLKSETDRIAFSWVGHPVVEMPGENELAPK